MISQVRSGELRGLAVTTTTRSDAFPDVPTVSDFVPGYDASAWYGFGAPRNTPPNVIETLYREISASAADPKLKSRGCRTWAHPVSLVSPAGSLGKLLVDESAKWGKVIKFAGVKEE